MTQKLLSVLSLVVVCALLLAGCAPTPAATPAATNPPAAADTQAPAATEAPAATQAPAAGSAKIRFWHIVTKEDQKAQVQAIVDQFKASHPGVEVEVTVIENENFKSKLTTVMQSGDPPDLFQSWGGGVMVEYAKAGLLKDISADMTGAWKDSFAPGALAVYGYQGKQYGAPTDMGMVGFWYNKDLFKQAGIDKTPTTWTEFLDDVKKLKAAGITPIAVGGKDKWPGMYYWTYLATRIGGKDAFEAAMSRKGSFADAPFVEAGKKLQELIALEPFQDGFLGLTYGDEGTAMGNGKAAMELMGQWAPAVQKDNSTDKKGLGDKLGWFPFPMVEGGKGNPADAMGGGGGFVLGKNAPKETIDLLKMFTTPEEQANEAKMGMLIPVVKGGEVGLSDPLLIAVQKGFANAPYFQLYYDQFLPPATGSVVNDSVQELFAGTKTPEQVAQAIEDSAAMEIK